jgi:hypothetical protein
MKTRLLFLFCAVLLASMVLPAGAATSFFGPSGLLVMPTAETLGQGQLQVFANYIDRGTYQETPIGVSMGLSHGIEVGVSSVNETGLNAGSKAIFNVKWIALPETDTMPAVAVGAINATDNTKFNGTVELTADKGMIAPYFVASKKLALSGCKLALTGHAGYIGGNFSGAMLGVGAKVTPKLDVMADWIGNYSNLSFGARYQATDSLGVNASLINGDLSVGTAYIFMLK